VSFRAILSSAFWKSTLLGLLKFQEARGCAHQVAKTNTRVSSGWKTQQELAREIKRKQQGQLEAA